MCPDFEQLCPTRRPLPRSYTRLIVWIAAAEFGTEPSVVGGSRLNCWPFALHCFVTGRDGTVLNSCIQRWCPHARTRTPPPPQNLGAGPPRPALLGAGGFRLSCTFPPPTSPRPGGGFPTLGTGRRRGEEPRRARADCFVRSCASAARMGVFSPSTPSRAARPGASASASAAAAPFASAVKVVARTRSAMLPLASNGCFRSNSCRRAAPSSWRSWANESDTAGRGSAWLPAPSRRGSAWLLPAPSRCSAPGCCLPGAAPPGCGSAWLLPARPAVPDPLVWLSVSIDEMLSPVCRVSPLRPFRPAET